MSDAILVVGYGNPLRTDDGIGWHVAERLAGHPRLDGVPGGVAVLCRQQLTPELALDVSAATTVVFVDARRGLPPGTFTIERPPRPTGESTRPRVSTWSHHLTPASLVAVALELYGQAADVVVVGCGVESLDVGDDLSPSVDAGLEKLVDALVQLIELIAVDLRAAAAAEPAERAAICVTERRDA